MGGKRIAEQVRRALILAAKTGPIVAVLESAGCHAEPHALCPGYSPPPDGGSFGGASDGGSSTGGARFGTGGMGGRSNDASADAEKPDATDAGKDGG